MRDVPNTTIALGRAGEQEAAEYLSNLGWQIVERNWRCPIGELDICALAPNEFGAPTAVAVEVKTRSGLKFGDPLEAITWEKTARLRKLAAVWARSLDARHDGVRLDAVGVLKWRGRAVEIHHVMGL